MFSHIVKFELNYYRKQPVFFVMAAIFLLLPFLITVSPNVSIGLPNNILANSPFAIISTVQTMSFFALFVCINYVANSVLRDFDHKNAELIFCTQVRKQQLIFARFFAAFLFSVFIMLASFVGVFLAEALPFIEAERLGAFNLSAYSFSLFAIVIPNLFIISAIMFLVATITRSLMAVYVSGIALITLFSILFSLVDPSQISTFSIFDPFGSSVLGEITRYWTPQEQNTLIPEITGSFLANRVLWIVIGLIALAFAYKKFPFSVELKKAKKLKKATPTTEPVSTESKPNHSINWQNLLPTFDQLTACGQLWSFIKFEVKQIVKDKLFIVMLLLGIFNVVSSLVASTSDVLGVDSYPTMLSVLNIINGSFTLPLIVVVLFYSAELIHREKQTGVSSFINAMPFPNWSILLAKFFALSLVVTIMLLVAMLTGILFQLAKGFFAIDLSLYFQGLFLYFQISLWLFVALSIFLQVVIGQKYIAMFAGLLYIIAQLVLPQIGFDQFLYLYAIPSPSLSAFTGFSLGLDAYIWHAVYWGIFTILLFIVAQLFWQRGPDNQWKSRWSLAKERFSGKAVQYAAASIIAFTATGSVIYYNTHILNTYYSLLDLQQVQADYEHKYKANESLAQPDITDVSVDVDIFPEEREVEVKGKYTLANNTNSDINQIHISIFPDISIENIAIDGATLTESDPKLGYYIYSLAQPLAPNSKTQMQFNVAWRTPGFVNRAPATELLSNGTFFDNSRVFPAIGYSSGAELQENTMRHRYGLADIERAKSIDDPEGLKESVLGRQRVNFDARVSTSLDQIAVAPGYLEKEWVEGNRRYFSYKMDAPIWNFFSFLSADYQVKRDKFEDIDIEVYYKHPVNVDRMIESTKKSMAYFEKNFSPYQYRQFRIFEFPAMRGQFAQAFANTVPFSETIGFTTDIRNPERVDLPFYVTAHELAHQWWAHQVAGANVQGSTMIIETLAQYSALMVMEQEYGKPYMQRFLKNELDRYLNGRGGEIIEEMPLSLVENQSYIHYRKGSLAMYALQDAIGADKVNAALSEFLQDYAFKSAPYPTSRDLLTTIRKHAGQQYNAMIDDLFEHITVYDLKVDDASYQQLADGRFEVTIDVQALKNQADGQGIEKQIPINDSFDIAVFGDATKAGQPPEVLYLKKQKLTKEHDSFTIIVNKKPSSVGIDPFNKMIDRIPDDNTKSISAKSMPTKVTKAAIAK